MRTSQSFPFYSSDFIMGTMLMTTEEVGAYIRMLCWQWEQGSIPSDPAKISRITGVKYSKIPGVLEKFDQDSDGNLKNFRMEEVRTDRENFMEVQRQNGKKGGRPKGKRPKPSDSQNKPMGFDRVNPNESQHEPKKTLPFPSPSPLPNTPLPPEGDGLESSISKLFKAEGSTRPCAPFSASEKNQLKTLVARLTQEQMEEDLELFTIARSKGWQYYSRDRKTLMNQWDKQVMMAEEFRVKWTGDSSGSGQYGLLNPQRGKC